MCAVERNRQNRSAFAAMGPCSYIIVECDIASSIRYQRNYTPIHPFTTSTLSICPCPSFTAFLVRYHHLPKSPPPCQRTGDRLAITASPLSKLHWQKPQPSPTRAALRR